MTDQYPGQPGHGPYSQQQPFAGGAASWDHEPNQTPGTSGPGASSNGWAPAPKPGLIPLRPLSFGEIFGSTFKLLRVNAGISIGGALVVQGITALLSAALPIIVAIWASNRISMAGPSDAALLNAALPGWILLSILPGVIVSLVGSALLQVVIVQVVAKGILSQKAKLGPTLRFGGSRFWPIVGYFALYFAVIVVLSIVLGLLIALAVWLGTSENSIGMLLVILLTILLGFGFIVGAIWIGTKLTFAMPAIVLERLGPIQGIRRSWGLSKGYFWRTFGILLLLQVIIQTMSQVVGGAIGLVMGIVPSFLTPSGGIAEGQEGGLIAIMIVLTIVSLLLSILIAAIGQVLVAGNAAIMYTDLRMRKEGLNIHLQSAVETYAEGREPEQDPWLAPDLGPLPKPAPYGTPAYPQGYAPQGYPPQGNAPQGYAPQGYGQQGPGAPGYTQQGYGAQAPGFGTPENEQQGYGAAPGYGTPESGTTPGYGAADYQSPGYDSPGYGAPGTYGQSADAPGYGSQAPGGQAYDGQTYGGQTYGGQASGGQTYDGQPYGGQTFSGYGQDPAQSAPGYGAPSSQAAGGASSPYGQGYSGHDTVDQGNTGQGNATQSYYSQDDPSQDNTGQNNTSQDNTGTGTGTGTGTDQYGDDSNTGGKRE